MCRTVDLKRVNGCNAPGRFSEGLDVSREAGSAAHTEEYAAIVSRRWTSALLDPGLIENDLRRNTDRTAEICFSDLDHCSARLVARSAGLVAGIHAAGEVFRLAGAVSYIPVVEDGSRLRHVPCAIAQISGNPRALLSARRTAMNLVARLSSIATTTAQFVDEVGEASPRIVATRKTTPGLGELEAYAVELGGGLVSPTWDPMVFWLKQTHHDLMGGVGLALTRLGPIYPPHQLHVECQSLGDVEVALCFHVDRIVLDKMSPSQLATAVRLVRRASHEHRIAVEATGDVTLSAIRAITEAGVDFISVGMLTKCPTIIDVAFEIVPP